MVYPTVAKRPLRTSASYEIHFTSYLQILLHLFFLLLLFLLRFRLLFHYSFLIRLVVVIMYLSFAYLTYHCTFRCDRIE